MTFPWVALGSAALGIGSSLFGDKSKNDKENAAIRARNKARREQFKAERRQALVNMQAQNQIDEINYAWQIAETEALRFQEAQAKSDYEWRQGRLTEAALAGLEINQQAIFDQYVTAEDLRATQDTLNLNYEMDSLALAANDAARGYMQTIRQNALQQEQEAMAANRQMETLIRNQVIDGQLDTLQRDIQFATSLAERGQAKSSALTRGASATTAKSLQMNTAKELGRTYGELLVRQRSRRNSIATLNATLQGEVAKGLARYALSSSKAVADQKSNIKKYGMDGQYQLDVFEKLTMPGYKLAARQGQRELDSLFLRTQGQLDEASMPYRENIIFDPQKPLPQMLPTFIAPNYEKTQSLDPGNTIVNALGAGLNGALKGTYTKSTGAIGWF